MDEDMKWFVSTCHPFQTRQLHHLHPPPIVPEIPSLFRRVHIDTMPMLTVNKFYYLMQACCALSSWPKWHPLQKENEKTLGDFIFEEILCRWGRVAEIVMDNGLASVAAAAYLSEKYSIHHIKVSPYIYNLQANGLVECKHFDVCESLMKACDNDHSKWVRWLPPCSGLIVSLSASQPVIPHSSWPMALRLFCRLILWKPPTFYHL